METVDARRLDDRGSSSSTLVPRFELTSREGSGMTRAPPLIRDDKSVAGFMSFAAGLIIAKSRRCSAFPKKPLLSDGAPPIPLDRDDEAFSRIRVAGSCRSSRILSRLALTLPPTMGTVASAEAIIAPRSLAHI
eukprot:CAMPEP_0181239864 /NCGR_PEP_ID=MMETSP1096-20121128/40194_1 /TAXON_ID=156174 ORGANISM="Chrysochromulina ericina, Strain CCMP281" /NCGR_SAMPLE_ID=MMETSP1096 /ASSEMBLY_ACC=CAM_ASM_000453 /LENGTH=133 /DNA_ID=CAMNT_0023335655 /DNA_START=780 /DNA_END=1181 /DNA_ORIENTATION=+